MGRNVIISAMENIDFANTMTEPLRAFAVQTARMLPGLAAAFLLLLVGLLAARGLRALVERALQGAKLDERTSGVGINELLTRLGFGKSPTFIAGFVVYWFILLAFIVAAANAVELRIVSELIARFLRFLPSVVAAVLILFGGLLFSRFLSEVVANAAAANDIRGGTLLARATPAVILVFSILMALEQLNVQMPLVTSSIQILLASAGLAFALAFGLGAKDIAGEMVRELINRKK